MACLGFSASPAAIASRSLRAPAIAACSSAGSSVFSARRSKRSVLPVAVRRTSSSTLVASAAVTRSPGYDVSSLSTEARGDEGTLDYRLYYTASGVDVSPWHDIPLYTGEANVVNYVNEIPKGTDAKMEIATDEASTPIKQDVKKGALRFYKYSKSLVNYGALPQTWEDPADIVPDTGLGGDGDPLDCIDISPTVMPRGAVYPVKVLGTLALLDEGETDWKILAVNVADEKAALVNTIDDVEAHYPGIVGEVREWFRVYKTAEGKGLNEYAFDGKALDSDYAMKVIANTNSSWAKLCSGEIANEDGLVLK
ncbi:hypothetical protein MMPV_004542 [Pyropia vietnamensis]